ncbi:Hypothetical predicted protein [Scomber scombrus]|uniref:Uncharacterized protein n=1 Tax=Scomber scombrus TaxID=13677 RepID=A0AAV1NYU1_SCOSC
MSLVNAQCLLTIVQNCVVKMEVRKRRRRRRRRRKATEHANFEFSPTKREQVSVSLGNTHTPACTVCVCAHTSRKRQPVYTSICLNAKGLPALQRSVAWIYSIRRQKLSSSCFLFTSL